eukprot:5453658-Alexandrium_andersonii.AAC.1
MIPTAQRKPRANQSAAYWSQRPNDTMQQTCEERHRSTEATNSRATVGRSRSSQGAEHDPSF